MKWPWFWLGKKKMVYDRGRYKEEKNVGSQSSQKGIVGAIKQHQQEIADIDAEIAKQYK